MYEQETARIENKIDEFTKKANIKRPKLKINKDLTPASVDGFKNELYVSERTLSRWHNGILEEEDIDAIFAHEVGHLINYDKQSHFRTGKYFFSFATYFMLIATIILASLICCLALRIPELSILPVSVLLIGFLFAPWVIGVTHIPRELSADKNAVTFTLIKPQTFANAMVRSRLIIPPYPSLGPIGKIHVILSLLEHPSLNERLRNIGFEIKQPVQTQEICTGQQK